MNLSAGKHKKVLFVATIHRHFVAFHLPYIKTLKAKGYEIHVVAANDGVVVPFVDKQFYMTIERSPYHFANLSAINYLARLMELEKYSLVTCHTPMGGFVGRMAARISRLKYNTKVLYTAHGFHFYKGAPLVNWFAYFPVEMFLAKFSDAIVTINKEDFELAKKIWRCGPQIFFLNGIGLDLTRLQMKEPEMNKNLRFELGLKDEDFVCIYIAGFTKDKNHLFLFRSFYDLEVAIPNVKIIFAGDGSYFDKMKNLAKSMGVEDRFIFLGHRDDVPSLIGLSNIGISPSLREGLPMNLLETLAMGKPFLASDVRGHRDIIQHGVNGFLFNPNNTTDFTKYAKELFNNLSLQKKMGLAASKSIEKFSIAETLPVLSNIYEEYISISC